MGGANPFTRACIYSGALALSKDIDPAIRGRRDIANLSVAADEEDGMLIINAAKLCQLPTCSRFKFSLCISRVCENVDFLFFHLQRGDFNLELILIGDFLR